MHKTKWYRPAYCDKKTIDGKSIGIEGMGIVGLATWHVTSPIKQAVLQPHVLNNLKPGWVLTLLITLLRFYWIDLFRLFSVTKRVLNVKYLMINWYIKVLTFND